jgi:hypothetical protein
MSFLISVKGYTRLDEIISEVIRKESEISGIQEVSIKHKQNWVNHLERMDDTRVAKHSLNYQTRGRRYRGRARKRWQSVDTGTGQTKKKVMMMMMMYPTIRFFRHNRPSPVSQPDTESHQQLVKHNYVRVTNYI